MFENKLAEPSIGGDKSDGLVKQKQKLVGGGLEVCCLNVKCTPNWNSSGHIFVISYSDAVSMVTLLHLKRSVVEFPRALFWVLCFSSYM